MASKQKKDRSAQAGFGLVEIMVGLAIGLITTLVIMQVLTNFEAQKRTTGGLADAQTNGSIALYTIQRQVELAGFGLPLYSADFRPLACAPALTVPDSVTTDPISLFPIEITDGGTGSDTVMVRSGPTPMGGAASRLVTAPAGTVVNIQNNLACKANDILIAMNDTNCASTKVTAITGTTQIGVQSSAGIGIGTGVACIGGWAQKKYSVSNGNLMENDLLSNSAISVAGIVNMQAQYGISLIQTDNKVDKWVNATGAWANASISVENRKLIKAIRIAVVARNGLLEKEDVPNSTGCSNLTGPLTAASGICAWEGTPASPAPVVYLVSDSNWKRYRYRVFETIVPVRNLLWNKDHI